MRIGSFKVKKDVEQNRSKFMFCAVVVSGSYMFWHPLTYYCKERVRSVTFETSENVKLDVMTNKYIFHAW